MNENDTQTPPAQPDATATNPAPVQDEPPVSTEPILTPQEQIDAEAEKEVQEELQRLLAEANGEGSGTEDGGNNAAIPVVETPAVATTGEQPPAQPPATPATEETAPPQTPEEKAQLDAERKAYGKLGGRISKLEAELSERDAKLAELEKRLAQPTHPAGQAQSPETKPTAAKLADAEITDEERKEILGDDWESEWGKDGADEEIRKQRRMFDYYQRKFGGGGTAETVKEQVKAEISAERESARREAAIDAFLADLDKAVPAAEQLDREAKTNGFDAYLDGYAPGSMTTRRQTLAAAYEAVQRGNLTREDYDRALGVAKSIYETFATQSPRQGATQKPATIDPAKLAMPRIAGGASTVPPSTQEGRVYTEAEVESALEKAAESTDPGLYDRVQEWAKKLYMAGKVKK